jgi:hypothetical protein
MFSGIDPFDVGAADGSGLAAHLHLSVPWPVWVALAVLCFAPALLSLLAWSASHRRDAAGSSRPGGPA